MALDSANIVDVSTDDKTPTWVVTSVSEHLPTIVDVALQDRVTAEDETPRFKKPISRKGRTSPKILSLRTGRESYDACCCKGTPCQ
jgi:hypothetical protein